MSTETPPRKVRVPAKDPSKSSRFTHTGSRPRPTNAFEVYSWYFFRVSGILLLIFVMIHLVVMHLINNVEVVDYRFISERWASPLWRTFDLILLFLALAHGINGVRTLIYDYIQSRGWRLFSLSAMYTTLAFFLLIGAQVIFTFQPVISTTAGK